MHNKIILFVKMMKIKKINKYRKRDSNSQLEYSWCIKALRLRPLDQSFILTKSRAFYEIDITFNKFTNDLNLVSKHFNASLLESPCLLVDVLSYKCFEDR